LTVGRIDGNGVVGFLVGSNDGSLVGIVEIVGVDVGFEIGETVASIEG